MVPVTSTLALQWDETGSTGWLAAWLSSEQLRRSMSPAVSLLLLQGALLCLWVSFWILVVYRMASRPQFATIS